MKYNNNNLVVASQITKLEDELQKIINDINDFKNNIKLKFSNLEIEENTSLLNAINKLKQLNNITDKEYGNIYSGEVYDLENESINKNEIKFVTLVKPGQRIEFTISTKSYIKPINQFTTGANQFIVVDWGDGTATQGYQHFSHTYDNVSDSFKPFNDEYKQVVITIKPTCYLEEEDILMPNNIAFSNDCKQLVLGININFLGISSEFYTHSIPTINIRDHRNLRYYYTTEAYIGGYSFYCCYRLQKIKANKLYINNTSNYAFMDCWNLALIDADIIVDNIYDTTNRVQMFADCYNLTTIKSLNFGTVNKEADYQQLFANCFKLREVPQLTIDCSVSKATTCEFFYNCMSLMNPFKYLSNINMLKYAYRLFEGCNQIIEAPEELDLSLATNTNGLFASCINMQIAPKRLYLDASTNCSYLFSNCWHLQKSPLVITAPNCTNINYMFERCFILKTIDCDLDFSNIGGNFANIFDYCYSLEAFNSNILKLNSNTILDGNWAGRYIFQHASSLKKLPKQELSINILDTYVKGNIEEYPEIITLHDKTTWGFTLRSLANIKKMPKIINIPNGKGTMSLFSGCTGLTEINDLTINIDQSTNIGYMFENCYSLESIKNLTINAPNATNMIAFFKGCYNLKTLFNVKINVKADSGINMSNMFDGCRNLENVPDIGLSYEDCASTLTSTFYNSGIKEVVFNKPFKRLTSLNSTFYNCRKLEKIKIILETDIDYVNWLAGTISLRDIDINVINTNISREPIYGLPTSNSLTKFKIDCNNTVIKNNGAISISNCSLFNCVELNNYANTGNITFDNNPRLQKVIITFKANTSANIYIRTGNLSIEALNEFFTNLPTVSGKTLFLKGQININECDKTIATNKGWVINTTT